MLSLIQFGFRKKCNIISFAVFHLVAEILKSFHNKTYCIRLFLDQREAFDTVNVEILVEKLKCAVLVAQLLY